MAITATLYSAQGKAIAQHELPIQVFGVTFNEVLVAQAVRTYTSRQRQSTKKAQTRAEVSFTTAKMWRQKGTGKARHGSRRAPIFVGGGVAHGPKGNENYKLKLSKKMRQAALFNVLSQHAQNHTISLIDSLESLKGKTNLIGKLIIEINKKSPATGKTLIVLDSLDKSTIKSVSNIPGLSPTQVKRLNFYEILNSQNLILTLKSLEYLSK